MNPCGWCSRANLVGEMPKRTLTEAVAKVPEVHCSGNWAGPCEKVCDHLVIRPNGIVCPAPCRKQEREEMR